jgi:hypothetical protein
LRRNGMLLRWQKALSNLRYKVLYNKSFSGEVLRWVHSFVSSWVPRPLFWVTQCLRRSAFCLREFASLKRGIVVSTVLLCFFKTTLSLYCLSACVLTALLILGFTRFYTRTHFSLFFCGVGFQYLYFLF